MGGARGGILGFDWEIVEKGSKEMDKKQKQKNNVDDSANNEMISKDKTCKYSNAIRLDRLATRGRGLPSPN